MPLFVYFLLFFQLIAVAYIDFRFEKIHNLWAITNLFLYVVFLFVFTEHYHFNFKTLVFPFTFLVVGYVLYLIRIMGAGDSKYLFSFFFLVPVAFHESFFVLLAYTTVFVGLFLIAFTVIRNFKKIMNAIRYMDVGVIKEVFGSSFSYAPVIFVSWVWFGYVEFF